MNELEVLKSQLAQINNSRVKYQTLIEQAKAQCDEIMTKYNISSLEELQKLYDIAQAEYQQKRIQNAQLKANAKLEKQAKAEARKVNNSKANLQQLMKVTTMTNR